MDEAKDGAIELLRNPGLESILYILFLNERTQKEAIEYFYSKEYSKINVKPFKEARARLLDYNLLVSDGSLRNAKFRSNIQPFIDFVVEKKDIQDKKHKKAVELLINSEWFKSIFSLDMIEFAPEIVRQDRTLKCRYGSEGAFNTLGLVLDDLAAFASSRCPFKGDWVVDLEDLADYPDFKTYFEEMKGWPFDTDWGPEDILEELRPMIHKGESDKQSKWSDWILEKLFIEDKLAFRLPDLWPIVPICHFNSPQWIALQKLTRSQENLVDTLSFEY